MRLRSALVAAACLALALPARAIEPWNGPGTWSDPHGIGLGVGAGVAIPDGAPGFNNSFNWGFFVDIPIIDSFHITPSTLLYKLRDANGDGSSATDVSLNFKFNVPIGRVDVFAGVMVGLTSTESLDPHGGVLAGATYHLLPNFGLFAQFNYKYIFRDANVGGDVKNLQLYAGPMFRF